MRADLALCGRHYQSGERIRLIVKDGRIASIEHDGAADSATADDEARSQSGVATPEELWIAPGLVDLQVNGYRGYDLNQLALTTQNVRAMVESLWETGVTGLFPTIVTNARAATEALLRTIVEARRDPAIRASIPGIHLEGPYISSEDGPRGAHDKRYVRPPDWEEFLRWQDAAEGLVRLVTLSPEWPGAPDFIRRCANSGVRVAIGHTAASSKQIEAAVDAGATLSTHLGNGAHKMLPRHPNYIWDQLANDSLHASFIADGFHLPDSVIRVILKMKLSTSFLISDVVALGGMPPGRYKSHIGGNVVLTEAGQLYMAEDPTLLAGSVSTLLQSVCNLANKRILPFSQAWDLASTRPLRYINPGVERGLVEGEPANIVCFHRRETTVVVEHVFIEGKVMLSK